MAPARFLILDDDEGVRLTFAQALALQGYSVKAAGSAREALYQIAVERPDAILVDLKMPLVTASAFSIDCGRLRRITTSGSVSSRAKSRWTTRPRTT